MKRKYLGKLAVTVAFALLIPAPIRADEFYVANFFSTQVTKFDANGAASNFGMAVNPSNAGIAIDFAGNVYVSDATNNIIMRFDPNGNRTIFATTGLAGPVGLAFDAAGNLYAANGNAQSGPYDNTIVRFDPLGNPTIFASSGGTGQYGPFGLAFDSLGNLYAANLTERTIMQFDPLGNGTLFATLPNAPVGIAIDASNNVYVTQSNAVLRFTGPGSGTVFATGFSGAWGMTFDSAGFLYVVNQNNDTISKVDPNGVVSLFANQGMSTPEFIAAFPGLPIPEPSSIWLSGAGLAVLLAVRIRRKRLPR